MAISFGHKDNQWRSKYSFRPKAMMNSSRSLISKGDSTNLYKHNEGDVNRFYGEKSSSLLGVAFNDNPSSNKVFKSISLEGSDILKERRHDFAPCTSTEAPNQNKYYLTSKGKNMGGITYNTLGKSDTIVNGTSLHYVGDVTSVNDIEIDEVVVPTAALIDVDTSNSAYTPLSNDSVAIKYGFYFPDTQEFYFGSDIIVDDGGNGEPGGGGGPTDQFDNCDALELYSSSQFYETVFYPDIGYLYLYIPNSVPVGDQTYILPYFLIDGEPATAQYVDESMDYYDQFRWSWRVFVGEPSTVSMFLTTYSGSFLDDDGNPIEGYLDEPSNACTFGFAQVRILQGDIDPSVACSQLSSAFSYSVTPASAAGNDAVVTVTFEGNVLQDPEFTNEDSYIYLYSGSLNILEGIDLIYPSEITYTEGVGTIVVFEGVTPNTNITQSYGLYFVNGDCDQFYINSEVYVPENEVASLCQDIYDNVYPILIDIYNPSEADTPTIVDNISFEFDEYYPFGVSAGAYEKFVLTLGVPGLLEDLQAVDLAAELNSELGDEVWGDPRFSNLKVTIAKDWESNIGGTYEVVTMNLKSMGQIGLQIPTLEFECEGDLVTDGEWTVFLDVAPCTPAISSYSTLPQAYYPSLGFRIKRIEVFQGADYCDDLFDKFNPSKYSILDEFSSKTVTPGILKGSATFDIAVPTDLDAEDVVLILCGPFGDIAGSSSLPHDDSDPPVVYVQDGGNSFDNPGSDITSEWTRTASTLRVKVSNIPTRSPDFDFSDEDTYVNRYSFVFVSKTCYNALDPTSARDYYRDNSPWNDVYGIQGSVITDSDSPNDIGGRITFTYGEADQGFFTPTDFQKVDLDNDGSITTADLLIFLTSYGVTSPDIDQIQIEDANGDIAFISADFDGDGIVGTSDLLELLTVFGDVEVVERQPGQARNDETIPLVDLTSGSYGLSDIPSSITATGQGVLEYTSTSPSTATLGINSFSQDIISYIKSDEFPSNAQLFAFLNPNAAGDELRGQTAELILDLGQEDFELFAVNLNYELLNADHTK